MPSDKTEMVKRIENLSDEELIEMIEVKFKDYTEEAIHIARKVVEDRGGMNNIKEKLRKIKDRELEEQKREEERQIKEAEFALKKEVKKHKEDIHKKQKEMVTTDHPEGMGYFSFRKMVSTHLIKVIYILGLIAITIGGIGMIVAGADQYNGEVFVLGGIALLIIGNLLWRILCEGWILLFSIHDILGSIEKEIKKK